MNNYCNKSVFIYVFTITLQNGDADIWIFLLSNKQNVNDEHAGNLNKYMYNICDKRISIFHHRDFFSYFPHGTKWKLNFVKSF